MWPLVIYSVAAVIGVRSLLALMAQHHRVKLAALTQAENDRRAAAAKLAEAERERLPGLERSPSPSTQHGDALTNLRHHVG